jgi:hypothetical protein
MRVALARRFVSSCEVATRLAEPYEVERALADENYRSIQARNNASVTASGRSMVDRWPQSCTISSLDPAIPSAIVRATETGVRSSSLPTSTSVGQLIAPNDGRESGLDMIAFCCE